MNHVNRDTAPILHEFLNHAGQTKVVSSFVGKTSSTYEFQMLMGQAHAVTPLSVQLATGMDLPRIACVTLPAESNHDHNLGPVSQLHESYDR